MRYLASVLGSTLLMALLVVRAALAHPFHVSLAEMEYDQEADVIEVALRVFPDDLELALRSRGQDGLVLERAEGLDALILEYLREAFVLHRADQSMASLEWVGMELGIKEAWIYFLLDTPGDLSQATLANRLFFDVRPSQINTVALTVGPETRTLSFDIRSSSQPLLGMSMGDPVILEVERRRTALRAIIRGGAGLESADRHALDLLADVAAQFLLHGATPGAQAENLDQLLDSSLGLLSERDPSEVEPSDLASVAILASRAGRVRPAFNLLAQAVAIASERNESSGFIPSALEATARLARDHGEDELADELARAAQDDASRDDQLLALGRARAYLDDHDHD